MGPRACTTELVTSSETTSVAGCSATERPTCRSQRRVAARASRTLSGVGSSGTRVYDMFAPSLLIGPIAGVPNSAGTMRVPSS